MGRGRYDDDEDDYRPRRKPRFEDDDEDDYRPKKKTTRQYRCEMMRKRNVLVVSLQRRHLVMMMTMKRRKSVQRRDL